MVFKPEKFRKEIEDILRGPNTNQALLDWLKTSPVDGKPLKWSTWIPRQSQLRNFLLKEYNYNFKFPKENYEEYRNRKIVEFKTSPTIEFDVARAERWVDETLGKIAEDIEEAVEEIDRMAQLPYNSKVREETNRKYGELILVLFIASGRRPIELFTKYKGLNDTGDRLVFDLAKTKLENRVEVAPIFIPADEWDDYYHIINPLIDGPVHLTRDRLNDIVTKYFPPQVGVKSLKDMRTLYATLCAQHVDEKHRIYKIKECLNHRSIDSSARYVAKVAFPEPEPEPEPSPTRRHCSVCGSDVKKKGWNRHVQTKKHQSKIIYNI